MFALRRWWDRYAIKVGLVAITLGTAWAMRETQGVVVYEAYQWITRPLQPGLTQTEQIENAYVLELQQRLVELDNQNRELRQTLNYAETQPDNAITAAVIGRSADQWWHQIVLGRGSRDGIQAGHVVVGVGGLVGRVTSVTPNTSRVLLVSDPTSRVGVKISRSRSMGYIRGQSGNRVVMEFFDRLPDVNAGDVVTTSSYSRLFPADVPIGRIESIDLSASPAPEAVVQLSAPMSALEWVIVQPFEPLEEVDVPGADLVEPGQQLPEAQDENNTLDLVDP